MRCLAIAPITQKIDESEISGLKKYSEDTFEEIQIKTQADYIVESLHQCIYTLNIPTATTVKLKSSFLVQNNETSCIVVIFDLPENNNSSNTYTVQEVEGNFSEAIESVIDFNFKNLDLSYLWINRTLITTEEGSARIPNGWLGRGIETYKYYNYNSPANEELIEIRTSWGNNIIKSYSTLLNGEILIEYCKGMIDAQFIWIQYKELTEKSRKITKNMNHGDFDTKKYTFLRDELLKTSKKRALLNTILDEVETQLQGIRYHIVTMSLRSWDLDSVKERLYINLEILDSINNQNHNIVRSKEQSKVDNLLLVLSMLTLTQFILMFVDLSYNGGADQIPGNGIFSLGFLEFVRSISADIWVAVSVLLTFSITYIMMRKQK